jgi:hypothetical protein
MFAISRFGISDGTVGYSLRRMHLPSGETEAIDFSSRYDMVSSSVVDDWIRSCIVLHGLLPLLVLI